jgi:diphosphomevalonate decarboxylase
LFKPNTINIINLVVKFREETGTKVCFTLDAGANVHLLYPKNSFEKIQEFIKKSLAQFCHDGEYINDQIGLGPQKN